MVLDCAEDKPDDHEEYGHTICCEAFRRRESRWLEAVAANEKEYTDPSIKYRLVVAHNPFTERRVPPFNIEEATFAHWGELLRDRIKPNLMLSGHVHRCYVSYPGGERDAHCQPCPIVASSRLSKEDTEFFVCGAITLDGNTATVRFVDNCGIVTAEEQVEI